jgi:hypothetical protein
MAVFIMLLEITKNVSKEQLMNLNYRDKKFKEVG